MEASKRFVIIDWINSCTSPDQIINLHKMGWIEELDTREEANKKMFSFKDRPKNWRPYLCLKPVFIKLC